ncbi:hypothetical protein KUCAC02_019472 [Chaenocephalus aceratus]|uniref:Uncharacterized protein n=1 Tax=Chaenocephalus aceratus TaxID=36190 RepID=A0ACB9VNG0_CHAAC|nr:hypothetical protein KUCAC02_019472 [Chaenocephalus aceratus]
METLLKAPLHAFQQRDEVNFEMDLVEKTMIFSDNAFMDMTQSQTINIASSAELLESIPHQNHDVLPARGEKTFMFGARDASRDMTPSVPALLPTSMNLNSTVEKSNISSAMPLLHPGYENCFSKISGPSVNPLTTRTTPAAGISSEKGNISMAQMKTFCVDEENRFPTSAVKNKSLNTSRKIGDFSYGSAISPQDDLSMDMTEAQTGRILRSTDDDDDDPFQCLFPTQEMYSQHENRTPQTAGKTKQQPISKTPASFNPKDMISGRNRSMPAQRHRVTLGTKDECRDKTIMFSASDKFMNMTQSHPVNIASGSLAHRKQNIERSPPCGKIDERKRENTGPTGSEEPFQFMFPSHYMYTNSESVKKQEMTSGAKKSKVLGSSDHTGGEKTVRFNADDACMDVTRSHTVKIVSDLQLQPQPNLDFLPACGEKTVRFNADDACMDVTRSHTAKIDTNIQPQSQPNVDFLPARGEKTVRFNADDACMDVTRSHTVKIVSDLQLQPQPNLDFLPACGEKTVRFNADDACMDVTRSHTAKMYTNIQLQSQPKMDILLACGEKTVRFNTDDACMDVTRSHTVKIVSDLQLQPQPNLDFLPARGEKTVRFNADDACMDVTRSHTAKIDTNIQPQSQPNVDFIPARGEKTVGFNADDACMDVTRSHSVNIATDLKQQPHKNVDFLPACVQKTMGFSANDAAQDVTRSRTVNISTDFEPKSYQNVESLPACGEKTVKFNATDAAMDVTQFLAVNIASNSESDPHLPHRESNILSTNENRDFPLSAKKTQQPLRNPSAHVLDNGFKNTLSIKSGANAVNTGEVAAAAGLQDTVNTNGPLRKQKPNVDTDNEAPGFISAVIEKPVNKTMTEDPQDDVSIDMTEAQTGSILGQTCTDEPPQCPQINEALGCLESINVPNALDSKETYIWKEPEPRNQTCTLPQKMESNPGAVVDAAPSRKSRRISLADIQSKVRRLSHMMNTAPDTVALDSCTAPVTGLGSEMDQNSMDKTAFLPVTEPAHEIGLLNTEENPQAQCLTQEEPSTTPYNLKTKQLMSRLSVGGFKAKLPQRNKPDDQKKESAAGEHTTTVNVTHQLSNFDDGVIDIFDEELGSYEDVSETLDIMSPPKATEKESATQDLYIQEILQDNLFQQDLSCSVNSKKRPLPEEENNPQDEKRWKTYNEAATEGETGLQSEVEECDGNITAAPSMTAHTPEYATSSHTASTRCEATFESSTASKQSLFESQLEDCTNDLPRTFEDGTVTVLEFLRFFNIHFVIHNNRESILPRRLQLDTDCTQMDLLKDKHINGPKMMVYETDVLNLKEMVEGSKERMQDLDRPLKIVNRALWEEVRNASGEELKTFGAKLKERNKLFRKMSKVQSHEMKEVLYSKLVLANLEEQQKLRGTIRKADEMMKSLDDCIHELQTELAAVEEKGFEDKPSLKSLQEDMQEATEALADNDRRIAELEMQRKQSSNKLNKLRTEKRSLESHVSLLDLLNEWKFAERSDNSTIYSFLHKTLDLQLLFEKPNENDADKSERKISHITFKFQLDDEKSKDHARLVHKLVSQYVEGNTDWVEKYPTSRHVPTLLHDVSLVVSRCRLLGEELRLLNMWGSLRFDILSISCVDTQVHIVFSCLKAFSKFEVIFSVSLIACHCVLKVQSFKNMIGNTTIQQIEVIVASFSPAKNVLTKIVKKLHETLLC